MLEFLQYLPGQVYNFLYSVFVPGINIPFIYFFILISVLFVLIDVARRIIFMPHKYGRNASVKGNKNSGGG